MFSKEKRHENLRCEPTNRPTAGGEKLIQKSSIAHVDKHALCKEYHIYINYIYIYIYRVRYKNDREARIENLMKKKQQQTTTRTTKNSHTHTSLKKKE